MAVIEGTSGDDNLHATVNNDTVFGYAGNDSIYGANGDDRLEGGEGNDILDGAEDDDRLFGDGGNDDLDGGVDGNDTLDGGDGNDNLRGRSGTDTLFGGAGDDRLNGVDGDDTLDGGGDIDTATYASTTGGVIVRLDLGAATGAGNDTLIDIEVAIGGSGDDTLIGSNGDNTLSGNAGDDSLDGGGNDTLEGGSDTDTLFGDDGKDELSGGGGADTLFGDAGADMLDGGDGDDRVEGGAGDDLLIGGAGAGDDTLDGGADIDTLTYASTTAGVLVALSTDSAEGTEIGTDTLSGIENVIGGSGADSLIGDNGDNSLDGGDGTDLLIGAGGDDVLDGGSGDDSIFGFTGDDVLDGGDGDDALFGDTGGGAGNDTLLGGDGADTLDGGGGDDMLDGGAGDDSLDGGDGTDTVTYASTTAGVRVSLHDGTATGTEVGSDTLTGFESVIGGSGDDTLDGGADVDFGLFLIVHGAHLNGGYQGLDFDSGSLSFVFDHGCAGERTAKVTDAAADLSLVFDDGETQTVLRGPVVHATERGGSTGLNADGMAHVAAGRIDAGTATALRIGFEDTPGGGDEDYNDVIIDLAILPGTDPVSDTLAGGAGVDTLTGGVGEDLFQFGAGGGTDRITDFQVGSDRFELLDGLTISSIATVDADGDTVVDDTLVTLSDGSVELIGVVGVTETDLLGP